MKNLYLPAILLPAELTGQVEAIRQECAARYGTEAALKTPLHIGLFRTFRMEEEMESRFLKLMQVCAAQRPFELELEHFDSFNNHTLFIRVNKSPGISSLHKSIGMVMRRNRIDPQEVKGNTLFRPHISIAFRDVSPEVFAEMWEEYKNRKFLRRFSAERFSLLKHDGRQWNVLKDFVLNAPAALTLF